MMLSISAVLSCLIVYRAFLFRKPLLKLQNLFYLGHVFVLTVLLFSIYAYVFLHVKFKQEKKVFNQELWKTDVEGRAAIVDNLIDHDILRAKRQTEVIELLGPPIRTYYENKLIKMAYYAGFRNKPFAIDPEFLMVEIKNGYVDRYYLKEGVPYLN